MTETINVQARTDFRRYVVLMDVSKGHPVVVNYALAENKYRIKPVMESLVRNTPNGDKLECGVCYVDEFDKLLKYINTL